MTVTGPRLIKMTHFSHPIFLKINIMVHLNKWGHSSSFTHWIMALSSPDDGFHSILILIGLSGTGKSELSISDLINCEFSYLIDSEFNLVIRLRVCWTCFLELGLRPHDRVCVAGYFWSQLIRLSVWLIGLTDPPRRLCYSVGEWNYSYLSGCYLELISRCWVCAMHSWSPRLQLALHAC